MPRTKSIGCKDRVKLQEAATARVREQLEALESAAGRAGARAAGAAALSAARPVGHGRMRRSRSLVRELAQQREDRERRQFLAELNRQVFERQQAARAQLASAEHAAPTCAPSWLRIQGALARQRALVAVLHAPELLRRRHGHAGRDRGLRTSCCSRRAIELQQIEEQGGAQVPRAVTGVAPAC